MNALIISLKFHPGHFSHLIANYKMLFEDGFKTYLYVQERFNEMDIENKYQKLNSTSDLKKFQKIDVAVFWFPSLRNIPEMIRLRLLYKAKVFYVYHEPFESIASYYKAGFDLKKIFKICLINVVHVPILLLARGVILPSASSFETYRKKYTFLNTNFIQMNLLFDDEAKIETSSQKKYFSYIGTIAADHAFNRFVDFATEAIKNNWLKDLSFQICTSSTLSDQDLDILKPFLESGRIRINSGKPMSNSEINSYYNESAIVWNAYNRSMQSGVLPKAFMFGTPVVMLRRNANEYLENMKTGVFIEDNGNLFEIKSAAEEILSRQNYYFEHCRKMFINKFYYRNQAKSFFELINK